MQSATLRPITVRRREAASMLGIGTSLLDELIASGQIDAKKSGKNLLIVVASLEEYVSRLPAAKLNSCGYYKKKSSKLAAPVEPEAA
jgi:excisionase family DNA binding protein